MFVRRPLLSFFDKGSHRIEAMEMCQLYVSAPNDSGVISMVPIEVAFQTLANRGEIQRSLFQAFLSYSIKHHIKLDELHTTKLQVYQCFSVLAADIRTESFQHQSIHRSINIIRAASRGEASFPTENNFYKYAQNGDNPGYSLLLLCLAAKTNRHRRLPSWIDKFDENDHKEMVCALDKVKVNDEEVMFGLLKLHLQSSPHTDAKAIPRYPLQLPEKNNNGRPLSKSPLGSLTNTATTESSPPTKSSGKPSRKRKLHDVARGDFELSSEGIISKGPSPQLMSPSKHFKTAASLHEASHHQQNPPYAIPLTGTSHPYTTPPQRASDPRSQLPPSFSEPQYANVTNQAPSNLPERPSSEHEILQESHITPYYTQEPSIPAGSVNSLYGTSYGEVFSSTDSSFDFTSNLFEPESWQGEYVERHS